jgi:hypothetical protein
VLHTDALIAVPSANGVLPASAPARVVVRFCERLRHLPLGVWAELAESASLSGSRSSAASQRLREHVDRLPGVATHVTPRVQELVSVAEEFVPPAVAARMRNTALTAALALLVREKLSSDDFDTLYEPFARAIPVAELERDLPKVQRIFTNGRPA